MSGNESVSFKEKAIRLGITTAFGALGPIPGIAASVLDVYFVDKWKAGYTPKIFFDDLGKLSLRRRAT